MKFLVRLAAALLSIGSAHEGFAQDAASIADSKLCSDAVDEPAPAGKAALANAVRDARGARASFLRACEHMQDNRVAPGVQSMESAVREEPNNPMYHFWLGRAYGEQAQGGNPLRQMRAAGRAKASLERAVQLAPDYLDAREGVMQFYLQAPGIAGGSVEKARVQAREIARRNPFRGAVAMVQVARKDRDPNSLFRAFDSAIAQFPDSAALYHALIAATVERKDWVHAWSTVERLQRAQPGSQAAGYAYGRLSALSGQRLEAGEQYLRDYLTRERKEREPSHAGARWRLGMILAHRGDRAGARREYQEALRLDATLAGARESLKKLGS